MRTEIYWIRECTQGQLGILPRPRAGDWLVDEVRAWRAHGIDTIVSLLTAEEVSELGLEDEPSHCRQHEIGYISFPVLDRQVHVSVQP